MAFKVGNTGLTAIDHEGKATNAIQWPGNPVKKGRVVGDVTLNFDSDESTNYRMTFAPTQRTPFAYIGRIGPGSFKDTRTAWPNYPGIIGYSAPSNVTPSTLGNIKIVEFTDSNFYVDLDGSPLDLTYKMRDRDAGGEENEYHSYPMALTTGKLNGEDIVITGWSQDNYSQYSSSQTEHRPQTIPGKYPPDKRGNSIVADSSYVKIYDTQGGVIDRIYHPEPWEPDYNPEDHDYSGKLTNKHFGIRADKYYTGSFYLQTPAPIPHGPLATYNNLLYIGASDFYDSTAYVLGRLNEGYSTTGRPDNTGSVGAGKVYVYDMNTKNFIDSIRPGGPFNGWYTYRDFFGSSISIDSNLMAISSGRDRIFLYNLDSSDPYKPKVVIGDSSNGTGNSYFRYTGSYSAGWNKLNVQVHQGYIAVGHYNHDSGGSFNDWAQEQGKLFIFDSQGNKLYSYFDSSAAGGYTTKQYSHLGHSLCWAPFDSSRSKRGNLFVGAPGRPISSTDFNNYGNGDVYKFNFDLTKPDNEKFSFAGKVLPLTDANQKGLWGYSIVASPERDLLLISSPWDSSAHTSNWNRATEYGWGAIHAFNYNSGTLTNENRFYDNYYDDSEAKGETHPMFGGLMAIPKEASLLDPTIYNSMRLKAPTGLKNNIGQSGSILIEKQKDPFGIVDSDGIFTMDSVWWTPGGAEVDSAKRINGLTPRLGSYYKTRDMLNYYVFDSDKIFCSWQKDLR